MFNLIRYIISSLIKESIKNKDTTHLTHPFVYIPLRFPNMILTMATQLTRYPNTARFTALLTRIGLGASEQVRLITDGFTNMKELVSHFTYDMSWFQSHLTQLKITLWSIEWPSSKVVLHASRVVTPFRCTLLYWTISQYLTHSTSYQWNRPTGTPMYIAPFKIKTKTTTIRKMTLLCPN